MVIPVSVCGASLSEQLNNWQCAGMRMEEQGMPISIAVICQDNVGLPLCCHAATYVEFENSKCHTKA